MIHFKKLYILFVFFIVNVCFLKAQDIQLFTEDFQSGGSTFTLNGAGPSSDVGNNQWIINSEYNGILPNPNTIRQDSTYGGTIGGAPYSSYLHINDVASGAANCSYDPASQSDRFTYLTDGLCTLGMDSVHFSFFYLCEGSATAYGKVYYSKDNGPWIPIGQSLYNNKYKWKYENITNPVFSNVGNLRFGFRWENDSGAPPNTMAFGIDDINIVASYNTINPITITVDSVSPNPVCQGTFLTIYYSISDTLCDGTYSIELSTSTGNFPSTFNSWVTTISYPQTSGTIGGLQLSNAATPGTCYKIRISRTSPEPVITGIASACFTIEACPNVIATMQPVVTYDTNAVCIGSAIDIPFSSTGVYVFNTYTAQLSDSNGTFPATPVVVGTFSNSETYDPALGQLPGSVSGQVPVVPPGCNYYIRVVSDGPVAIGSPWGPFCIWECDITTNNKQDLSYCIEDCSVAPLGQNSIIPIDVNTFDNTAIYYPGNLFSTQLLSSSTMTPLMQIGSDGILGSVAATGDTTLNIHIPCKDSLPIIGVPIGMNYMRVIATNSSVPDNNFGSLIRVTIGAIRSTPQIITSYDYGAPYDFNLPYPWIPMKDTFCSGETVMLLFEPYSYSDMSTYKWICSGINGGNPFVSPSGANSNSLYINLGGPGILTFKVQETSYGCVGAWSPIDTVVVLAPPNVLISGPSIVCQGDTNMYQVPFSDNTYYNWTSTDTLVDPSNNETGVKFVTTNGIHSVTINALNQCGSATATKTVQVKAYPLVNAGNDTIVCINEPVLLSTPTGTGYNFSWSDGTSAISSTNTVSVAPTTTTTYTVTVTGTGGCLKKDSVKVQIQMPTLSNFVDSTCPNGNFPILLTADSVGTYSWNTGANTPQILVSDTGIYTLTVNFLNAVCPKIETFLVKPDICPIEIKLPNVFSPNGDNYNDFFTPIPPGEFDIYDIEKFNIKIYSRWGELVYESTDPYFMWNGNNKGGKPLSDGVYYYIADLTLKSDKSKSLAGFITLTR